MKDFSFCGKKIRGAGFFGLGKSNLALLNHLKKSFPSIRCILRSDSKVTDLNLKKRFDAIYEGERAAADIREDILFLSPTVRRERAKLNEFQKRGGILSSEAEFFFANSDAKKLVITGSDGKSTTATLCSHLLSSLYGSAPAMGNIGIPMAQYVESPISHAVVELSSFQLNYFRPLCKRALITNITPNHLDWHSSFEEYKAAKENALIHAEERIFNADCSFSRELADKYGAFSAYSASIGYNELKSAVKSEHYVYLENGYITRDGEKILDTGAVISQSKHDITNFIAAAALCTGEPITDAIYELARSFTGLRHRREFFGEFGGVRYYDSSIDSTPQRTATTLESFSERVIIILGGKSKGLDYGILPSILSEKAKIIILTGASAPEIEEALKKSDLTIPIYLAPKFEDAAELSARLASSGDSVLLSPASTSYDRFLNFEERGEYFKKIIKDAYNS